MSKAKWLVEAVRGLGPRALHRALPCLLALSSCENPSGPVVCTAIAVDALNLTVLDESTGQRVCDARVTVAEGSFTAELRPFGSSQDCTYSGPTERAGRYDVQVVRAGYETVVRRGVVVTADECHVIPVRLTVPLPRSG